MSNLLKEKKNLRRLSSFPQHKTAPWTLMRSFSHFLPQSHTPEIYLSSVTLHASWGYGNGHEAIKLFITGLQLIIGL